MQNWDNQQSLNPDQTGRIAGEHFTAGFDAILLLGFGGPEGPDEVRPFVERVTAGRGIPAERLDEVAGHYLALGGTSPVTAQNRALRDALAAALVKRGYQLPVILANRNSPPFVPDALAEIAATGGRHVLTLATSAYPSYTSCRQYREDVGVALAAAPDLGLEIVKVPPFATDASFADAAAQLLAPTLAEPGRRPFVLATTHSIPVAMARASGPSDGWPAPGTDAPGLYVAQHRSVAGNVVRSAAARAGVPVPPWQLVFQSRSGPPRVPWLEPDIESALVELAADGHDDVVVFPIGFLSDHVEVMWDLDTVAAEAARQHGMRFTRVPTVGTHPTFVNGLADRLVTYLTSARAPRPGELCCADCCPAPQRPGVPAVIRPAIEGVHS